MTSSYDAWADVYDLIYSYVKDDIPFYVEEARRSGEPVLDLGCGTGRVCIPIAKAGIDVVGLDISSAMLRVARCKSRCLVQGNGNLTLVEADMRDFSLNRLFSLVIIPFRGFLSLLSVEDQVAMLLNVKRHLADDGRLIFNIFVPDLNMMVQEGDVAYHLRDVTHPKTGAITVLWHQSRYDNYNQIMDVRIIVEELDGVGTMMRRFYRDFPLRYAHRWEVFHLLRECGYEILDLYGDFDRSPFDETSTEMVWVAGIRT